MILNIQDDILKLHALGLLDRLLADKTTKRHIMWATDAYGELGPRYERNEEILPELITGLNASVIKTRARKELEQQSSRTRQRGEVFTPFFICQKMCDHAHEALRGKDDWKKYVDSRVLEITSGEAPFLASRYNVETGEIIPVPERIGLLDRKLRMVSENAQTEEEWLHWAFRAFHATYAYEFQGDNLLISRVNLLLTFEEHLWERWRRKPMPQEYLRLVNVVAWNVWQMDGLTKTVPYATAEEMFQQIDLFDLLGEGLEKTGENKQPFCVVYNWLGGGSVEFAALPTRGKRAMKFDFVIGNPPYQEETESASTRMPPLYHKFMEESYKLAKGVVLITPARFLFNAGYTPKAWNEKMLNDTHFSVLFYEADSSKVFANTDIKGGVCISYHDESKEYGAITTFTKYNELNHILKKVKSRSNNYLSQIVSSPLNFQLTDLAKKENPNLIDRLRSSAFSNLASIFSETKPNDSHPYICMIGLLNGRRVRRFVRRDYIREISNTLDKYTLLLSKANGAGQFGEILSEPEIAEPGVGYTQTFIAFGAFETEQEATNVKKYIHTKFARAMLGVLKITQDCPGPKWAYVPLQDFTPTSDIDWTRSIPEIDQQLYAKYGLDEKEIAFIESHVKEMA